MKISSSVVRNSTLTSRDSRQITFVFLCTISTGINSSPYTWCWMVLMTLLKTKVRRKVQNDLKKEPVQIVSCYTRPPASLWDFLYKGSEYDCCTEVQNSFSLSVHGNIRLVPLVFFILLMTQDFIIIHVYERFCRRILWSFWQKSIS